MSGQDGRSGSRTYNSLELPTHRNPSDKASVAGDPVTASGTGRALQSPSDCSTCQDPVSRETHLSPQPESSHAGTLKPRHKAPAAGEALVRCSVPQRGGLGRYLALPAEKIGHHGLQAHRVMDQARRNHQATAESKRRVHGYGIEMLVHDMVVPCPVKQYNRHPQELRKAWSLSGIARHV